MRIAGWTTIKKEENKMNKLIRRTAIVAFVLGFAYSTISYSADDVKHDHMLDAAQIKEQIANQDVLIKFHTRMKEEAPVKYFAREKVQWGPLATSKVREMNMHCDAIIQSAKRLKVELEGFANWHQEQTK